MIFFEVNLPCGQSDITVNPGPIKLSMTSGLARPIVYFTSLR